MYSNEFGAAAFRSFLTYQNAKNSQTPLRGTKRSIAIPNGKHV